MAKINGIGKNIVLITILNEKINALYNPSSAYDESLLGLRNGKKILKGTEETIEALEEIVSILTFDEEEKEESELFCFENVYLEQSKQERLFELINSPEIKATNITFPDVFGQYGEIPNTKDKDGKNLRCPRPRNILETTEAYEAYLEEYYKHTDFKKEVDENGIRKPYEHERFIWEKGSAIAPQEANYQAVSYKDYLEYTKTVKKEPVKAIEPEPAAPTKTAKKKEDNAEEKDPNKKKTIKEAIEERIERSKERAAQRRQTQKENRSKVVKRENIFTKFKKEFEQDKAAFKVGSTKEKFKIISKYLVRGVLVAAGGALAVTVGGPLLSTIASGIAYIPTMIGGAITGLIPTSSGAIALTIGDRIVYALISGAIATSSIAALVKIAKKTKKRLTPEETEIEEPVETVEPTPENNPPVEKTKEKEIKKAPTSDEDELTPPTLEGKNFEENRTFILTKLKEIGEELQNLLTERDLLATSPDQENQMIKDKLNQLKTKIDKLNYLRKQYISAYVKIHENANIEIKPNTQSLGGVLS